MIFEFFGQKIEITGTKVMVGAFAGATIVSFSMMSSFVAPAFRRYCIPYVPATPSQMDNILLAMKQSGLPKTAKIIDLGSGDGRVVLSIAKSGFPNAHGVELNRWLVYYSRFKKIAANQHAVKYLNSDMWKIPFEKYDAFVMFGAETVMENVEQKFSTHGRPNTVVFTCRFPLPTKTPLFQVGKELDSVWCYKI